MINVDLFNISNKEFNTYLEKEIDRCKKLIDTLPTEIKNRHDFLNEYMLSKEEYINIIRESKSIRENTDAVVIIGAGGSFIGTKAGINMFGEKIKFFFVGNSFDAEHIVNNINYVKDKNFVVNLVSKSGRTLEIITAFSTFKNLLDKKYGEESHKHIFITSTENNEGLHKLAIKNNNIFFNIPELIGGRYSIITPASLFPFTMNGMDIENIIKGFLDAKDYYKTNDDCLKFAITRNYLYNKGKRIDLFITYNEKMRYFSEWYKQLFGESQGKDNTGLFPSSAMYSTDLHSIGQYIQEGYKSIIENTLYIKNNNDDISIDLCDEFADEFGFVNGKTLSQISESCLYGTIKAHKETPNILVTVPHIDEYVFGWLIYFYEEACILGSILMGVNPFNQYGVEKYKKEMINKLTL